MRYCALFVAAGLILAVAGTAGATTVTYSVGTWVEQFPGPVTPPEGSPWGPSGYPGDTVALLNCTGTLDLTPGTYFQKINTLAWAIDYTYAGTATQWDYPAHWTDPLLLSKNAARSMTIGTASGSLSQTGLVTSTWENDSLSLYAGPTVSFLVEGYRVDVTPLGLDPVWGSSFSGDNPWAQPNRDVMARFDITEAPVPEPLTMAGLGLGIAGLVGYLRRRRG